MLDKLTKNRRKLIIFLGLAYLLSSIVAAGKWLERSPATDPVFLYIASTIVATLLIVFWYFLAEVIYTARHYANAIKGSREAPAFLALSNSLLVLLISLVIVAFINVFRISPVYSNYKILTIITYYTATVFALMFMYYIGRAGRVFAQFVKQQRAYATGVVMSVVLFSSIGLALWPGVNNEITNTNPTHLLYYMPSSLVLVSLYIPIILAWMYGTTGTIGIYLYYRHTKGVIYREMLKWLTIGMFMFIFASFARQVGLLTLGAAGYASVSDSFARLIVLLSLGFIALYITRKGILLLGKVESIDLINQIKNKNR